MRLVTTAARIALGLGMISTAAQAAPTFIDVTADRNIVFTGTTGPGFPGLDFFQDMMQRNMGNGAAVGDYDGDGDLDVYLLGYEGFPNVLLRNNLDLGTPDFTDVTAEAKVGNLGLSRVAHFADLDNDGRLDLVVLNDNDELGTHPVSTIYRNDGGGKFTDVTAGSNFVPLGYLRCGMALADYDLDGLLDIYVTNWKRKAASEAEGTNAFPGENRLYRNLGGFVFEDVTDAVGLGGLARDSFTALFVDLNDDRRPELFVAVDHFEDELYHNTEAGFVRLSNLVGISHVGNDMGAFAADMDDDGDVDIYTTNITGPDFGVSRGNAYYENLRDVYGNTTFVDRAIDTGIEDSLWGWGVEPIDPDNDGDLDIFAVTGFDEFIAEKESTTHPLYQTTVVYFENNAGSFTRYLGGQDFYVNDSRGLVAFDYDRDGDEDLLITNVDGPAKLFENVTANQGHWLDVKVTQRAGQNRNGIGVTVLIQIDGVIKRREILAGESFLAGTPAEAHFGLGAVTTVPQVRVDWTDGASSYLLAVPADQLVSVVQPEVCTADFDASGQVGQADLDLMGGNWGACPAVTCPWDLSGNGSVGSEDLALLALEWKLRCP